jgi:hypothetical protein
MERGNGIDLHSPQMDIPKGVMHLSPFASQTVSTYRHNNSRTTPGQLPDKFRQLPGRVTSKTRGNACVKALNGDVLKN